MMLSFGPDFRTMKSLWKVAATMLVLSAIGLSVYSAMAAQPGNEHFQRTWQRTDQPVLDGLTARTWMWGPAAFSDVLQEPYAEAPGGVRDVQYFDKARMEITTPSADANSVWYVTNGLLVVELVSGNMQIGHTAFEQRSPAQVNVAGDSDDPTGPTYATFGALLDAAPHGLGAPITERVERTGEITEDPALSAQGVITGHIDEVTNHAIAAPFWDFMNSSGPVYDGEQFVNSLLFENPFFATGRPVTEAYWANVKVAGTYRDVLMQCFERRCLTYTPGNPEGFIVEAGNVGQHYYSWRYDQQPPSPTPSITATASAPETTTATPSPTGTATATVTTTATMTVTATASATPITEYEFAAQWGKAYSQSLFFTRPRGLTVDGQDHVWVTDFNTDKVVEFDELGLFVRAFGSTGTGDGQFDEPSDVALSEDGRVYVVDQRNQRIQVFNADGEFLMKWGEGGSGDGQLANPNGIAIYDGRVYVSDGVNYRIQIFTLEGVYQSQFGKKGTGNGEFDIVGYLAFDPEGNLHVADYYNNRVQKFTKDGVYLSQFGSMGSAAGQLYGPSGLAFDALGNIYVADFYNHRIQKFDTNGLFLEQWGPEGRGFREFIEPIDLAADSLGNVYVTDAFNRRLQKLTLDGEFLYEIRDASRGTFGTLTAIDVDQNGDILTIDTNKELYEPGSVSRYTPDGVPLETVSRTRPERSQYDQLAGVAVNLETGDIYVTDRITNRIQRFTTTWQYRGTWGMTGTIPGQFSGPTDIAIDADGNVYVTDTGNNRVQKFDANGVFLEQWGGVGDGNGQFKQPSGIVIDGERVYVSDNGNHRVQVFDREGKYLAQWGALGAEPGQFNGPAGIAVNPQGLVLVVDLSNNRVQIFSPDGQYLNSFGTAGSEPGQFNVPYSIAIDADGHVYVTDIVNDRVQKFTPAL